MSSISNFEASRVSNNITINLDKLITNYMIRKQRSTRFMIRNYVYTIIGDEYKSGDFDNKINSIVDRISSTYCLQLIDGYFTVPNDGTKVLL